VFGAIYFLLKEGVRWRLLDQTHYAFPRWESVYSRWRAWAKSGFLRDLLKLAVKPRGKLRFVDASHIKTHQDACRHGGSYESRCIGKTKGGLNAKVTAVADSRGHVAAFCLSPGNRHDLKAMQDIKPYLELLTVVADRGYDSRALRAELEAKKCRVVIPTKKNAKVAIPHCARAYKKRHLVENAFQRMKRWRRVGTRFDMLKQTFESTLTFSFLVDWMQC
jgi:transposase